MLKLTIKAKMLSRTCWDLQCCFLLWLIKDQLWAAFVFVLLCLGLCRCSSAPPEVAQLLSLEWETGAHRRYQLFHWPVTGAAVPTWSCSLRKGGGMKNFHSCVKPSNFLFNWSIRQVQSKWTVMKPFNWGALFREVRSCSFPCFLSTFTTTFNQSIHLELRGNACVFPEWGFLRCTEHEQSEEILLFSGPPLVTQIGSEQPKLSESFL